MGLQELMMFRDNLQQPAPTGMDNLRNLQALTLQGMAAEDYINQPMMNTGIMSLPVAQAGFGGFIKSITRIPRTIAKTVKRVAKSPVGSIALGLAAPTLLGPSFLGITNPALQSFLAGTGVSLLTGQKPKEAIKRGGLAALTTGLTRGFTTPGGAERYAATAGSRPEQFAEGIKSSLPLPDAPETLGGRIRESLFTDIDRPGTLVGREVIDPVTEFFTKQQQAGLQPGTAEAQAQESLQTFDATGTTPAGVDIDATSYQNITPTTTTPPGTSISPESSINPFQDITTAQYPGGTAPTLDTATKGLSLDGITGALRKGVELAREKPKTTAAILAGAALLGSEQDIPQSDLDMAGITKETVDTDFDKQRFVYRDAQGNPISTEKALQMIQAASQGFGEGGQRMASGVRGAFERVDDPVLSASGGLIGMAYGGSMPMNNMDVKYKEFSGMVGGRGSGMEDNVYMPIVEGEQGQQVATLAVSPKEYVVDANTMSLLGNGNPDEGAEIMDKTVKDIRMAATGQTKQQKEIDGLAALNRMRRSV
jgi:hypothetical protein